MITNRNIRDAAFIVTRALPTADGTVTSADIDLGPGDLPETIEFAVTIPDLTVTHLPDADTLTITHQSGAAATPTTARDAEVITGAGGAGAAGAEYRFRAASNGGRYHNFKFVAAGGTGDMSGVTATIAVVF